MNQTLNDIIRAWSIKTQVNGAVVLLDTRIASGKSYQIIVTAVSKCFAGIKVGYTENGYLIVNGVTGMARIIQAEGLENGAYIGCVREHLFEPNAEEADIHAIAAMIAFVTGLDTDANPDLLIQPPAMR